MPNRQKLLREKLPSSIKAKWMALATIGKSADCDESRLYMPMSLVRKMSLAGIR